MYFVLPITNITVKPDLLSETLSQGLYGEEVEILESFHDFYHIRTLYDAYEGYVPRQSLALKETFSTHYIHTRASLVFARADIKSPVLQRLVFGSRLCVKEIYNDKFVELETGGYAIHTHITPLSVSHKNQDVAQIAEKLFLGSPYHWGGKTPDGCDCSGLVQMSAFALGIKLPRDSRPQENFLEHDVTHLPRQRNDIVFWQGHVGIMVSDTHILHANAYHMQTMIEPLADVIARSDKPISSVKSLYES